MALLDIRYDERTLETFQRAIRDFPAQAQTAALAATKVAVKLVRQDLIRSLGATVAMRRPGLRQAVRKGRVFSAGGGARGEVRVAGRRVPLMDYKVTPERAMRRAVRYNLRNDDAGYDDRGPQGGSRLFVQRVYGRLGVWYRKAGTSDLNEIWAPSLQWHLQDDAVRQGAERLAAMRWPDAFAAEMSLYTGGAR